MKKLFIPILLLSLVLGGCFGKKQVMTAEDYMKKAEKTADSLVVGGILQTPNAKITGGAIDGTPIGGTTPSTGAFTTVTTTGNIELGHASDTTISRSAAGAVQIEGKQIVLTGVAAGRDFASTAMTNGDTQTALSEANMLAAKHVTNQGETVETDIILVAVSYPIGLIFDNDEGIVMEVCPPSGETVYLDGAILDADDCVDLAAAVDNTFTARRRQNASAAWYWSFTSCTGVLTDTAGTD